MHVVVTMTRVDRRFRSLMVAIAPNTSTGDNEGENSEGLHTVCWNAGAVLVGKDEIPYKSGCRVALCQMTRGGATERNSTRTKVW